MKGLKESWRNLTQQSRGAGVSIESAINIHSSKKVDERQVRKWHRTNRRRPDTWAGQYRIFRHARCIVALDRTKCLRNKHCLHSHRVPRLSFRPPSTVTTVSASSTLCSPDDLLGCMGIFPPQRRTQSRALTSGLLAGSGDLLQRQFFLVLFFLR